MKNEMKTLPKPASSGWSAEHCLGATRLILHHAEAMPGDPVLRAL
jgi:hypothetical protein